MQIMLIWEYHNKNHINPRNGNFVKLPVPSSLSMANGLMNGTALDLGALLQQQQQQLSAAVLLLQQQQQQQQPNLGTNLGIGIHAQQQQQLLPLSLASTMPQLLPMLPQHQGIKEEKEEEKEGGATATEESGMRQQRHRPTGERPIGEQMLDVHRLLMNGHGKLKREEEEAEDDDQEEEEEMVDTTEEGWLVGLESKFVKIFNHYQILKSIN
jgi:hypothetical protein